MSEWLSTNIGAICQKVVSGGTPLTSNHDYYKNGGIPWLKTKEVNQSRIYSTENHITQLGLDNSSAKLIPVNSVVIAMYGDGKTAGRVGLTKIPLATNQACCNLIFDENKTHAEFVFYYLLGSYDELVARKTGSGQQNLNAQLIKAFEIPLPSLSEQKAIASVLSSLDDKIDLLHRQNTTLERMAETLFRQWFVEEAQENWEECTLNDLISVKGGTTPSTKELSFWNGNVNWTSPRDLSNQQSVFMFDTERKITEKGLAQIGSGLLPVGTVLMSSRAPIGYLAISDIPVAINQGYIAIICDKLVSNYFMYLWCKVNMEQIKNSGNGSTFEEISKSNFKALLAVRPPKQVLENFHQKVEPMFRKVKCNQQQIKTLEKLRESLLPKLMSGEITVELGEINE
ncbi:MAG: restriction endonuclease subunit S [Methylotenera sp.]|nr:restriction endonuclease subunit S [Methylotenera sp.]